MLLNRDLPLTCPCERKSPLQRVGDGYRCAAPDCCHHEEGHHFRTTNGALVLISTQRTDTLCEADNIVSYVPRKSGPASRLKSLLSFAERQTEINVSRFVVLLKRQKAHPRVLVIGAGEKGGGTAALWGDDAIEITGVDIYKTPTVDIVCDAHYLPLESGSYDGVLIQAVLEHVVDPAKVVAEIERVLAENGIVYAETPFMQQVHEGAYDFTRFTVLGHRYLFRKFEAVDVGGLGGPEVAFSWSCKYLIWSIFRSRRIARASGLLLNILTRPLALLTSSASFYDAASATYFLGRKVAGYELRHKDLVSLYKGQFG